MRFPSILYFVPVVCALAQTPAPKPADKPAAPNVELKVLPPKEAPPAPPTDPNKVIITVGEHKITAGQFKDLVNTLPEQYRATAMGAGRQQFAENIARIYLMAEKSRANKVDQTTEFKNQ